MRNLIIILFVTSAPTLCNLCADLDDPANASTKTDLGKLIKAEVIEFGQEVHFSRVTIKSLNAAFEIRIVPHKSFEKRDLIERQIRTVKFLSTKDQQANNAPQNLMKMELCYVDNNRYYILCDLLPLNLRSMHFSFTSLESRMRVYLQMAAKVKFLHDLDFVHCRIQIDSFYAQEPSFQILRLKNVEKLRPANYACPDAQIEQMNSGFFGQAKYQPKSFDIARLGLAILRLEKTVDGNYASQAEELSFAFDHSFPTTGDNLQSILPANRPLYTLVREELKKLLKEMIDLNFAKRPAIGQVVDRLLVIKEALHQLSLNAINLTITQLMKNAADQMALDHGKHQGTLSDFINRKDEEYIEETMDGMHLI